MDRQELILNKIYDLLQGKFEEKAPVSDDLDEVDAIITGLNMLGEHIASTMVTNEAYKREKETAIKASNAKSQFLSNVSHELRTPLHGILSYAEFGLNKTQSEELARLHGYFENIQKSGKRLKRVVDDLLDLDKLLAEKMLIELEPANILSSIEDCIAENRAFTKSKEVKISIIDNARIHVVTFDRFRIAQVILNILHNAIKFSPQNGSVTISLDRITTKIEAGQTDYLQVSFKDEGPGIPESQINDIFDEFIQSDRNINPGGTGLGLAICREIIKRHSGQIWCENNSGPGSTFFFTLPIETV